MSLKFKVFYIPAVESDLAVEEMNKFLGSVRVVNLHREFVSTGLNSFWSFALEYIDEQRKSFSKKDEEKRRIDYKSLLSENDFSLFLKLRDWRKENAEKEGLPLYTLFTNAQLAVIAEKKTKTISDLKKIDGIGDSRAEKYGNCSLQRGW